MQGITLQYIYRNLFKLSSRGRDSGSFLRVEEYWPWVGGIYKCLGKCPGVHQGQPPGMATDKCINLYYLGGITMPFTCTSLPLNLYTSVFGCGCGFGFEQKFWRID